MQDKEATSAVINSLELFKSYDERIKGEREKRLDAALGKIPFGVSYLDDALLGIFKNDLILVGAKTGFGKTQLAMRIAFNAAKLGKRINFFALEAEECEIERRIKYQMIADAFYKTHQSFKLDYTNWYRFQLDDRMREIESSVESKDSIMPEFKTFYRDRDFSGSDFERIFLSIKDHTDLTVIDHLHYFDLDGDNENKELKSIVKNIRDCCLISGKPIILIAHLRKSDKKQKQIVPDLEDFHGSSDISKICTTAITLAPYPGCTERSYRRTLIRILKNRTDSSRCVGVAQMRFMFSEQSYDPEYVLGNLSFDGTEFLNMADHELPHWATNARRGTK